MTPEDIERIVKVIMSTTDRDIQRILKDYLAWKLMPPGIRARGQA
jgi:hypothetical protein